MLLPIANCMRSLTLTICLLIALTLVSPTQGQTEPPLGAPVAIRPTPPVVAPVRIETEQNRALRLELEALSATVASTSWVTKNPAKAARLQQLRLALAPPHQPQVLELVKEIEIPYEASATEEEFLVARAEVWNAYVEANNQGLRLPPALRDKALGKAPASAVALHQRMQDLALALSTQQTNVPFPALAPQDPPRDASPALRAFLAERDALARALYLASNDPAAMASTAIRARLDAFQNLATQLSKENPTTLP